MTCLPRLHSLRFLLASAALLLTGCGGDDGRNSDALGEGETGCEPGSTAMCFCTDGLQGTQTCDASGMAFTACLCDSGAGGATGTGGVTGTGSVTSTGGVTGTGGMGAGGIPGAGGMVGTGGEAGTGGTIGTGGSPGDGPALPTATGACPEFTEGTVSFSPAGTPQRSVSMWVDPAAAAASDGPVVFYWYGTYGQPSQAVAGLGAQGIQRIKDAGGVVVAPTHINGGTFPWIQGNGEDLILMDEVIGCAEQKIGIDARRIHSLGFSAGALFTTQVSFNRAAYIASVATYSGGGTGTAQDPNNKFAALIFHGGPGDVVVIQFQQQSEAYFNQLVTEGHSAFICNHGSGHSIPSDQTNNVVQFFFDHPYGTNPSPYDGGFPPGFPSYCTM